MKTRPASVIAVAQPISRDAAAAGEILPAAYQASGASALYKR
jgi:hypothetical protein